MLRLGSGWAESQQMNTIEPSPIAETSRDGDLRFTLGQIPKGQKHVLYIEFQVNPTNVGRRRADVVLYDGDDAAADHRAHDQGLPLMDIVFRGVFIFFVLYVLMRVIGRRELSSLEPFDLILLVVLGDAVQQGLTQDDYSLTGALLAIGTIAMLQLGVSYRTSVSRGCGRCSTVSRSSSSQDGKPIEKNLRRERMTLDDLAAHARSRASRTSKTCSGQ